MSQELNIEVQISSVEQITSGITTITPESIGAVPLGQSGKIDSSYLPDQASLDTEVDSKIATAVAGAGLKAGVQWTTRHTNFTGNPYLIGSIVYNAGRVYRCIAENDSMPPQQGGNPYWADLGVGYLLPNENPKILGGSIDISAGAVTERSYQVETGNEEDPFETENETTQAGGSNGNIILKGGNGGFHLLGGGVGGNAGSINTSGGIGTDGRGGNGGSILLVGGTDTADAGSINLSGGEAVGNGGSIISTGSGDFNGGTLNLSAGLDGHGGSISIENKGGSLNLSGNESLTGGSITLMGDEDGNGGTIIGSNNGGSIQFSGTRLRTGGSINLNAGNKVGSSPNQGLGGAGGKLELKGASGGEYENYANGGKGGTILGNGGLTRSIEEDNGTSLFDGLDAGTINFSAGSAGAGGSIDISDGGGSINTRGYGSIQLGNDVSRITLVGATRNLTNVEEFGNRTITLPAKSGTISLVGDRPLGESVFLKAMNFDLGKQTTPLNASLSVIGQGFKGYAGYFVSEISILIKSRYRTQPLSGNLYTIPAIQPMLIASNPLSSSTQIVITAQGTPYTHPVSGNYVLVNDEYMLIDSVFLDTPTQKGVQLRRNQLGSSRISPHPSGTTFGIYENTALFSQPPAVAVYNNRFGYSVSSDASIGTRPFVGNYSRTINTATANNSSGRQMLTYHDIGGINIQLVTTGGFLQTTTTGTILASTPAIGVVANTAFSGSNFYARITSTNGTENVYVTSGGSGANWNVLRGVLGTSAIAHSSGATISTNVGSTGGSALLADILVKLDPAYTL